MWRRTASDCSLPLTSPGQREAGPAGRPRRETIGVEQRRKRCTVADAVCEFMAQLILMRTQITTQRRRQKRQTCSRHPTALVLSVVDGDRRYLILGITIDKPEERRGEPALVFRRGRANPGSDDLGRATPELHRPRVHLMPPSCRTAGLAPDTNVGAASLLADRSLLCNESAIKTRTLVRDDFNDFHGSLLPAKKRPAMPRTQYQIAGGASCVWRISETCRVDSLPSPS